MYDVGSRVDAATNASGVTLELPLLPPAAPAPAPAPGPAPRLLPYVFYAFPRLNHPALTPSTPLPSTSLCVWMMVYRLCIYVRREMEDSPGDVTDEAERLVSALEAEAQAMQLGTLTECR